MDAIVQAVILLLYILCGSVVMFTFVLIYLFVDFNREYKRTRSRLNGSIKPSGRDIYNLPGSPERVAREQDRALERYAEYLKNKHRKDSRLK